MVELNKEQIQAIESPQKPVLIVAGAGTGKTRVLVERIIYLIKSGLGPDEILVITFTNKARDEIQLRVENSVNERLSNINTFHGFFNKLLREDIHMLDPDLEGFTIVDSSDTTLIFKKICSDLKLEYKRFPRRDVIREISNIKILGRPTTNFLDFDINEVYCKYEQYRKYQKILDYDDLEVYARKVLSIDSVSNKWKLRFKAILIDEFQDTTENQFEIIKRMVNLDSPNIFCVGDPDQSIYGFRYADPIIFHKFSDFFSNCELVKLEENYRSTKNILGFANEFISSIDNKFSKQLRTSREDGDKVVYVTCNSTETEISWVLREIENILKKEKSSLNDFLILYRSNYIAKNFELEIRKKGWEYMLNKDMSFFSRKEIKFIVSYLYLIFSDRVYMQWLENIIAAMPIGISEATLIELNDWSRENGYSSFPQIVENLDHSPFNTRAKNNIREFGKVLSDLKKIRNEKVDVLVDTIVCKTGYSKYLVDKKEEWRSNNLEVYKELLEQKSFKSNDEMMDELAFMTENVKPKGDFLLLSTVHGVKGLEYKYVFVVKMTQDIFPSKKSISLDEEKRIAYVAFTRAQKKLYITYSPEKDKYWRVSGESVFMSKIKKSEYVDKISLDRVFITNPWRKRELI